MQISLKNVKNTEKNMFNSTSISNVHTYIHVCIYVYI